MYKRDFGILLLSAVAVYVSLQQEGTFAFRKAWCAPRKVTLIASWPSAATLSPGAALCCRYFPLRDDVGLLETAHPLPPPIAVRPYMKMKYKLICPLAGNLLPAAYLCCRGNADRRSARSRAGGVRTPGSLRCRPT